MFKSNKCTIVKHSATKINFFFNYNDENNGFGGRSVHKYNTSQKHKNRNCFSQNDFNL